MLKLPIYQPAKPGISSKLQYRKGLERAKKLGQSKCYKESKWWEQTTTRNQPKRIQIGARRPTITAHCQAKGRKDVVLHHSKRAYRESIEEYMQKLRGMQKGKQGRKHRRILTLVEMKDVIQTYDVGIPSSTATRCKYIKGVGESNLTRTEKCELNSPKFKNTCEVSVHAISH